MSPELAEVVQRLSLGAGVLGVLLVVVGLVRICWPPRRVGQQVPTSDEHLLDFAYEVGVVRLGDDR